MNGHFRQKCKCGHSNEIHYYTFGFCQSNDCLCQKFEKNEVDFKLENSVASSPNSNTAIGKLIALLLNETKIKMVSVEKEEELSCYTITVYYGDGTYYAKRKLLYFDSADNVESVILFIYHKFMSLII